MMFSDEIKKIESELLSLNEQDRFITERIDDFVLQCKSIVETGILNSIKAYLVSGTTYSYSLPIHIYEFGSDYYFDSIRIEPDSSRKITREYVNDGRILLMKDDNHGALQFSKFGLYFLDGLAEKLKTEKIMANNIHLINKAYNYSDLIKYNRAELDVDYILSEKRNNKWNTFYKFEVKMYLNFTYTLNN